MSSYAPIALLIATSIAALMPFALSAATPGRRIDDAAARWQIRFLQFVLFGVAVAVGCWLWRVI